MKRVILPFISIILIVTLTGCVKEESLFYKSDKIDESWEISPTFRHDNFIFQGKRERMGVSNLGEEDDTTFIANKRSIYCWRFFGPSELFGDEITIKATSKDKNEIMDILTTSRDSTETPLINFSIPMSNGESSTGVQIQENITSQIILEKGIWRLDVYFDNKYFDSIVIEFQ